MKRFIAALAFGAAVTISSVPAAVAAEADKEERPTEVGGLTVPPAPVSTVTEPAKGRPAVLPALYASLGAMNAWDVYSTRAALNAGARESNPVVGAVAGDTGAMLGVKVVSVATTILFAERMWKKNRVVAVAMLVAINGATAAVSMNNMRNARVARGGR